MLDDAHCCTLTLMLNSARIHVVQQVVRLKDLLPFGHRPLCQLQGGRFAPMGGQTEAWYRQSYANHAGGTSQVKRMVLATRGMGLPR